MTVAPREVKSEIWSRLRLCARISCVSSAIACGPTEASTPDGLCGAALSPPADSCGNDHHDPGELCLTATELELPNEASSFFVLDANGDDIRDVLIGRVDGSVHVLSGQGDGGFAAAVVLDIEGSVFVEAPSSMPYDVLAVATTGDQLRLLAYSADADGEFETTTLDSIFAPDGVATSLGAGRPDETGASRVYVGVHDIESDSVGTERYAVDSGAAMEFPADALVGGQPAFAAVEAEGIWIADFDGNGYEDHLLTQQKYELILSGPEGREARRIDPSGFLFNHLRWLVDHGAVSCSGLDALNLIRPITVEAARVDDTHPEDEVWDGLSVARINADDALDLVFAKPDGTYVGLGSLAEAMEPPAPNPAGTEWPDVDLLDHPFVDIVKISDQPWTRARVVDLDANGSPDLVGMGGSALEILLSGR